MAGRGRTRRRGRLHRLWARPRIYRLYGRIRRGCCCARPPGGNRWRYGQKWRDHLPAEFRLTIYLRCSGAIRTVQHQRNVSPAPPCYSFCGTSCYPLPLTTPRGKQVSQGTSSCFRSSNSDHLTTKRVLPYYNAEIKPQSVSVGAISPCTIHI